MDVGNYINIFNVTIEKSEFNVFVVKRSKYPTLRELRSKTTAIVYPYRDNVYALGGDPQELTKLGFSAAKIMIYNEPAVVSFIVKYSFGQEAKKLGYELQDGFSNIVFKKNPIKISLDEVGLYEGFEYRTVFLRDRNKVERDLIFGLIVDQRFRLELHNKPASYNQISYYVSNKYGPEKAKGLIQEIRKRTGDVTPSGKRNPEASRFRYINIINFIKNFASLHLYDGSLVCVSTEPTRIILEDI